MMVRQVTVPGMAIISGSTRDKDEEGNDKKGLEDKDYRLSVLIKTILTGYWQDRWCEGQQRGIRQMNYENILATLMKGNSYDISIKAV